MQLYFFYRSELGFVIQMYVVVNFLCLWLFSDHRVIIVKVFFLWPWIKRNEVKWRWRARLRSGSNNAVCIHVWRSSFWLVQQILWQRLFPNLDNLFIHLFLLQWRTCNRKKQRTTFWRKKTIFLLDKRLIQYLLKEYMKHNSFTKHFSICIWYTKFVYDRYIT